MRGDGALHPLAEYEVSVYGAESYLSGITIVFRLLAPIFLLSVSIFWSTSTKQVPSEKRMEQDCA
jgi:hypothetical protein